MQLLSTLPVLLLASAVTATPHLLVERAGTQINCTNNRDNNGLYEASNGELFQIHCGVDYPGGDLAVTSTSTFAGCVNFCANTNNCVDVSYAYPQCYLKSTLTNPVQNPNVNTATAPLSAMPQICYQGRGNNSVYLSSNYPAAYQIECGEDLPGGDLSSSSQPTFQACIDSCSATANCVGAAYVSGSCYLKDQRVTPVANSAVEAAVLIV